MDALAADASTARRRLADEGWIRPRAESFRHLPPPAAEVWLGGPVEGEAAPFAPPAGAGWIVQPVADQPLGGIDARWLNAADPSQRAELFAGLAAAAAGDAAPLDWAHRALCRQGLKLAIGRGDTAWLRLRHGPSAAVEAPLLVVDLADGARAVLVEVHGREAASAQGRQVQNLQVHLRLGEGATLTHLRLVTPGAQDPWAHQVHARLGAEARYAQLLLASDSGYHLQHASVDLHGDGASARLGSVVFAAGSALQQQLRVSHRAARTCSGVESLVLARGRARAVVDAHTHIAPHAAQADARQRLTGIPTAGQPRLVLQPHLEIRHDQVQASHGATWGSLPEDALFYARQRGLTDADARSLILDGMAQAVVGRAFGDETLVATLGLDAELARAVARHLAAPAGGRHG